jgi:hypothetical protein
MSASANLKHEEVVKVASDDDIGGEEENTVRMLFLVSSDQWHA